MAVIAWDTETALFRPGVMAPELACVTWQEWGGGAKCSAQIEHWTDCYATLQVWLSGDATLVGHNVAYDFAVIGAQFPDLVPAIFRAYDANRITCTKVRQQLLDIAAGCFRGRFGSHGQWVKYGYSLLDLTKRHTGRLLEKDEWRLKYGELRALPLHEWPEGARTYPKEDAIATLDVYLAQERDATYLADQFRQSRAQFWLHLMSAWGLRTRGDKVEALRGETEIERAKVIERLAAGGLVKRKRAKGVESWARDTKVAKARMVQVCTDAGLTVRLTKAAQVSLDADACEASEDPLLEDYAEFTSLTNVIGKDVKALLGGTKYPVHSSFGMAASGRTTSSKPNVQNWRRLPGIRECFVPRPCKVFVQGDYESAELHTLAQVCIVLTGASKLGDALNAGMDPHTSIASEILGISYAEGIARKADPNDKDFDDARQTGKVANFGIPGGLGADKLVLFARKQYGVILTPEFARELKAMWMSKWTEMVRYFQIVNEECAQVDGLGLTEQLYVGRLRGGCTYCALCNTKFQGLASDGAKEAGWQICRACYVEPASPLFGSRTVNFVHDEFIAETDDTPAAHDAAIEMARLMDAGFNTYCKDVPVHTKPLLMRYWSKKAKATYDGTGRLIPWGDHV